MRIYCRICSVMLSIKWMICLGVRKFDVNFAVNSEMSYVVRLVEGSEEGACISLQVSPGNTNIAIASVSEYTDILYCIETGRTIWMKKILIAWKLLVTAFSLWRSPCSF